MTIERIKLDNGKIGVYRRCKKTLDKKIPNIDHLTPYERYCFLKHFYKDFADNTNRAYPKEELLDREAMVNVGLLFTACLLDYKWRHGARSLRYVRRINLNNTDYCGSFTKIIRS